ncbi:MAG: hypothetical protein K9M98_11020 [Cephaloticoccus sp.]|nr:hypothetical protein [Cephaloticoccus sp.]MCF7761021.1 hypothetical protein [Cephaloticoccus sp.]
MNGTITGVGSGHSYTSSQSVVFQFVLNDFNGAPAAGVASDGVYYQWVEDNLSDTPLYTSVSGTGITGSWSRSTAFDGSAYAYLQAHQDSSPGQVFLVVGTNVSPADMGISTGGLPVSRIEVNVQLGGFAPTVGSTLPDSTAYFSALAGTYTDVYQPTSKIVTSDGTSVVTSTFAVDSVTITAVPEPAHLTVLAGTFTLTGLLIHRCCRARSKLRQAAEAAA